MGVEILTRPNAERLFDLATAKTRLGITDSSKDALIGDLLDEVTGNVELFLGHSLIRTQYRETFSTCEDLAVLSRWPIDSGSVELDVDGTAVTDFSIDSASEGLLYRSSGFGDESVVDYWAGFKRAEDVTTWAAATAYSVGDWVRPTALSLTPYLLECTTAGTSDASEPTWTDEAPEATVADSTVVWTVRDARELSPSIRGAVWVTFFHCYSTYNQRTDIIEQKLETASEKYAPARTNEYGIPMSAENVLRAFRDPSV